MKQIQIRKNNIFNKKIIKNFFYLKIFYNFARQTIKN